jgi:hypothetical protein
MSKIRENVINIVQDILYTNHKHEEKRKLITQKENQLEMACPVCGDSRTNPTKKRGILYLDSFKYYCWNGECNAKYWTVFKFFKHFGKKIDNVEHINEIQETINKSKKERKTSKLIESAEHFEYLHNNAIDIKLIENHFLLLESNDCDWGLEFLKSRLLHRFSDRIRFRINRFGNKEVWIFNKINANDKVVGLQIKNLDFGSKYTTKTFPKLVQEMNLNVKLPENPDFLEKITTFSTIFNIFNVNIDKTITIFEGPLDSFFINNSVATAGASKLKTFFDGLDNIRYWFDNDSTGKISCIDKIKTNNPSFLWKKFFLENKYTNKKIKDLNELIVYVYNNLDKKESIMNINEFFSKNKYDIYNV